MDDVNNVLSRVMQSLGLDRRLREHTLVQMWPSFVPAAIAERSRPLFIDSERNLVVSVADAATGQEVSMLKSKLLAKLMPAARSLSLDIRGLRLDMKYFRTLVANDNVNMPEVKPMPRPDEQAIWSVVLTDSDKAELSQLKAQVSEDSTSSELQQKILRVFEIELRLKRWRLDQGFSLCLSCKNPAQRLHRRVSENGQESYLCLECLCKI